MTYSATVYKRSLARDYLLYTQNFTRKFIYKIQVIKKVTGGFNESEDEINAKLLFVFLKGNK